MDTCRRHLPHQPSRVCNPCGGHNRRLNQSPSKAEVVPLKGAGRVGLNVLGPHKDEGPVLTGRGHAFRGVCSAGCTCRSHSAPVRHISGMLGKAFQ